MPFADFKHPLARYLAGRDVYKQVKVHILSTGYSNTAWKKEVDMTVNVTVGRTFVFLEGERKVCRVKECNMGR